MSKWISVKDRLPDGDELKKYKVKMLVGSMTVEEVESVMLGKKYSTGFRFMAGDLQRVTHWMPLPKPPTQ